MIGRREDFSISYWRCAKSQIAQYIERCIEVRLYLFDKLGFVSIFSVSAMSLSISGRILSLYLDKSALRRADRICGIYCGLASPT